MKNWEDDTRHIRPKSFVEFSPQVAKGRESIAELSKLPVSARRERWEKLLSTPTVNSSPLLYKPVYSTAKSPLQPINADFLSIPAGERDRREREKELQLLRLVKRENLKEIAQISDKNDSSLVKKGESEDLPPPPPSPEHLHPVIEDIKDAYVDENLPEAPHFSDQELSAKSIDVVSSESAKKLKSNLRHDYYSRSKMTHSTEKKMSSEVPLARQRSVTFAEVSSCATGDSSTIEDESEDSGGWVLQKVPSSALEPPKTPSSNFGIKDSNLLDVSPTSLTSVEGEDSGMVQNSNDDDDFPSFLSSEDQSDESSLIGTDTEMNELIDTELETVANSVNEEDSKVRHASSSSGDATEINDYVHSDPEGNTATPHSQRSLTKRLSRISSRTTPKNGDRRSSFGNYKSPKSLPRSTDALVDIQHFHGGRTSSFNRRSDQINTPIRGEHRTPIKTKQTTPGGEIFSPRPHLSRQSSSQQEYRVIRFNEIQEMLIKEKEHVFQTSQALQRCFQEPSESLALASTIRNLLTPRKKKEGIIKRLKSNKRDSKGNFRLRWNGIGSRSHVDCCTSLLLACQRRQALMEESAKLYDQSCAVHLPQGPEAPIRAKLNIPSVRLNLKTSGGGYVLLENSNETRYIKETDDKILRYHIIALFKCDRDINIYHSQVVTVMHMQDAIDLCSRIQPANYIDLPCNIEIKGLSADFGLNIEIYCLQVGSNTRSNSALSGFSVSSVSLNQTPNSTSAGILSSASSKWRKVMTPLVNSSQSQNPIYSPTASGCFVTPSRIDTDNAKSTFILMSSTHFNHSDKLLSSNQQLNDSDPLLTLNLLRLPKNCPFNNQIDLMNACVRLSTRVLKRGFLTMFEQVGGFGSWQRYWCILCADKMKFYQAPFEEKILTSNLTPNHGNQTQMSPNTRLATQIQPVALIDFRQVTNPWAVVAPRRICARINTLYLRSLRPSTIKVFSPASHKSSAQNAEDENESLVFRASPDYNWFEQKHLLCADSQEEMMEWIHLLNDCLQNMQQWMPQHFDLLTRYDAMLEFSQPVSLQVANKLLKGSH